MRSTHRFFQRTHEVLAFTLGFELDGERFGLSFIDIVERRDGSASDIADGPYYPHLPCGGRNRSPLGGIGARLFLGGLIQAQSFGGLRLGAEFQSVARSSSHELVAVASRIVQAIPTGRKSLDKGGRTIITSGSCGSSRRPSRKAIKGRVLDGLESERLIQAQRRGVCLAGLHRDGRGGLRARMAKNLIDEVPTVSFPTM